MRAATAFEKPESGQGNIVNGERIGATAFKPADATSTRTGEDDSVFPGFVQKFVNAVFPPNSEHAFGVSAAYPNHILR